MMKKIFILLISLLYYCIAFPQNVGIGINTPGFPLNFSTAIGDKISLYGNSGNHYGFGIQGGLLQIYSDAAAANIAFGYGSSGAFTERARIINQGEFGMSLTGRLQLRSGTFSAGHWLTNMANTVNTAFIGMASDNQVGFYGPAGAQWGLTMNTVNGFVGIGNTNPNVPLAFPPALGKKITLYPGATGDVGFAVAGNRLQIYSDNPNADVAIGYDAAGTFNERFAVKPNGALAINGSTGSAGQVLQSNGSGSSAYWANKARVISFNQTGNADLQGSLLQAAIPGLDNQPFNLTEAATIVFSADLNAYSQHPLNIAYCFTEVQILNGASQVVASARAYESLPSFRKINMNVIGSVSLPAGIYTTKVVLSKLDLPSGIAISEPAGKLIIQIFPN